MNMPVINQHNLFNIHWLADEQILVNADEWKQHVQYEQGHFTDNDQSASQQPLNNKQ